METQGTLYLMYHELEIPGRRLCEDGGGYRRYVVGSGEFSAHLQRLRTAGRRGCAVGAALAGPAQDGVVITFDDGCESDWLVAAPCLAQAGFGATFYIVAGWVGQRTGYLRPAQLRELDRAGFEIGCHSMSHVFLSALDPVELEVELRESKDRLEQLIGRPVRHLSCPGGRWSPLVAQRASQLGYQSVATSRVGLNPASGDPFQLARVAVLRHTTADRLEHLLSPTGLWSRKVTQSLRSAARISWGRRRSDRQGRRFYEIADPEPGCEGGR